MSISRINRYAAATTLCMSVATSCLAQSGDDVRSVLLDSVVVSTRRNTSAVAQRGDGTLVWNTASLIDMPKILGNADPMHYAQMLPGIQTNAEYLSGIHIEGCDNSHNLITVGDVPIYNVNHLLGFFSVFNASHYSATSVAKTPLSAASASRIGGTMALTPVYEHTDTTGGEASVGLISSQATVRMRLARRTSATVSLRASYLNLLYGQWLRADGNDIRYSFGDANLTLTHTISDANTLAVDCYGGADNGRFADGGYLASTHATWSNYAAALHWLHSAAGWRATHTAYVTSYHNNFCLEMPEIRGKLPSSITDFGYKAAISHGRCDTGAELALHTIRPQHATVDGRYSLNPTPRPTYRAMEGSLYADYTMPLAPHTRAVAGVRGNVFRFGGRTFLSADPSLFLRYDNDRGLQLSAGYFLRHQYLFQTGFSDAGLPTEFWLPASAANRPQYAHGATAGVSLFVLNRRYRVSADVFFRRLYNQIEYSGTILDLLNSTSDNSYTLLHGRGENYGASLMLQKCSGKLTGWLSYTFTRARRTFAELDGEGSFPASHERPHELNAVATYTPWRHWSFGATLVYASGTPFTAPVSISLVNGNLLTQYGRHNANRLGDYMRIDLSANYKWRSRRGTEQGLNLSIYNATSRSNDLFYRIRVGKNGMYAYRPVSFVLDILPSISYFCRF